MPENMIYSESSKRKDILSKVKDYFNNHLNPTTYVMMNMYSLQVQGLSLNSAVIRFDLEKQQSFNQGQMNVAHSHVTQFKNLHLIVTFNCNAFQVN